MSADRRNQERDPRRVAGAILIAIGVILFVLQYVTGVAYSLIFMIGGGFFLIAYFSKRSYGFLIPGCIMLGIGLGRLGEEAGFGVESMSAVGLGLGFVAIYVIEKLYRGKAQWWPLIPGLILFVNGIGSDTFDFGMLVSKGWPIAIVVIGILFLTGKIGTDPRKKKDDSLQGPPGQP